MFIPPSLPCLSFHDLVLEGVYIVMISCRVLCVCVCDLTVNRMGWLMSGFLCPPLSCEIVWSVPRIAHQFRPAWFIRCNVP